MEFSYKIDNYGGDTVELYFTEKRIIEMVLR